MKISTVVVIFFLCPIVACKNTVDFPIIKTDNTSAFINKRQWNAKGFATPYLIAPNLINISFSGIDVSNKFDEVGELGIISLQKKIGSYTYPEIKAIQYGIDPPQKEINTNFGYIEQSELPTSRHDLLEGETSNRITITSISNSRVKGTFTLTYVKYKGMGEDTIRFTNGKFDVPVFIK
jgi:hypothetical protein